MKLVAVIAVVFALFAGSAEAGVVRYVAKKSAHVVKPVVKPVAKAAVKVAKAAF